MKKFSLILILLVSRLEAQECNNSPHLAFLLAGQSNMVGNAPTESIDTIPVSYAVAQKYWPPTNSWSIVKDPLSSGVSIGANFARAYGEINGTEVIGLLPQAVGGSSIISWAEGMNNFEKTISAGKMPNLFQLSEELASQLPKAFQLGGILWHQGEADANSSRSIPSFDYKGKLVAVLQRMRERFNNPTMPIVLGEIAELNSYAAAINIQIHEASALLYNSTVVETGDLTTLADGIHFDAISTRELGRRYFNAYQTLIPVDVIIPQPNPSPTPTPVPSPTPEPYCVLAFR